MAGTINAANISIGLDIAKLKAGMDVTRNEINQLRGILKDAVPATETYAAKIDLLKRAYETGAIEMREFERALAHLNGKMRESEGMMAKGLGFFGLTPTQLAGGLSLAGFKHVISSVDDVADAAAKIGVSYNELLILQKTLVEVGGITADQVQSAIQKMVVNIAKAKEAGTPLANTFKSLGLSADSLTRKSAVDAFVQIANSFEKIDSHAEKMQVAVEIFGKGGAELVPSLQDGAAATGEMEDHLRSAGLLMSDIEANQMSKLADKMERLVDYAEGFGTQLAKNVIKPLEMLDQELRGFGPGFRGGAFEDIRNKAASQKAGDDFVDRQEKFRADTDAMIEGFKKDLAEKGPHELYLEHIADMDRIVMDEAEGFARTIAEVYKEEAAKAKKDIAREFQQVDRQIENERRRAVEDNLRSLQSQADRLAAPIGENNSNIAPAIKAGTVEAYKFMNKQNDERQQREEARKQRETLIEEIRRLNNKNFAILAKAR